MRIAIVANPVSGGGRARRHLPAIRAALAERAERLVILETTGPDDAARFGRSLALEGHDLVIALGGDGTVGSVADGLISARDETNAALPEFGFIAAGTGMDFRRNFSLPADPVKTALQLLARPARPVDAGRVELCRADGSMIRRHFLNVASLGLSGTIAASVNAAKEKGSRAGSLLYTLHSVREILRLAAHPMRVRVDDQPEITGPVAMLAVANGRWFGGGMKIAPLADITDGLLELALLSPENRLVLLWYLIQILAGGAGRGKGIRRARGRSITVSLDGDSAENGLLFEMDGETAQAVSARYTVLPGALMIRA